MEPQSVAGCSSAADHSSAGPSSASAAAASVGRKTTPVVYFDDDDEEEATEAATSGSEPAAKNARQWGGAGWRRPQGRVRKASRPDGSSVDASSLPARHDAKRRRRRNDAKNENGNENGNSPHEDDLTDFEDAPPSTSQVGFRRLTFIIIFCSFSSFLLTLVGGVAQWLGRWSLAGGLYLIYA